MFALIIVITIPTVAYFMVRWAMSGGTDTYLGPGSVGQWTYLDMMDKKVHEPVPQVPFNSYLARWLGERRTVEFYGKLFDDTEVWGEMQVVTFHMTNEQLDNALQNDLFETDGLVFRRFSMVEVK